MKPVGSIYFRFMLSVLLAGECAFLPAETAYVPVDLTADFSRGADYPLVKNKFALYNSGFVPVEHYDRDIHLYKEILAPALRIDLWWGGTAMGHEPVSGTSVSLRYRFTEMDHIAELLNSCGVAPQWAFSYIPPPLQSVPGDAASTPTSTKLWGEILGRFAAHAAQGPKSRRVGYHEIYNEPDNRDFFHGTMDDYFALYRDGVRGIRAADPDAVVGGPAIAFTDEWISPFLEIVKEESLPLDFFSFHFYPGVPYESDTIAGVIDDMRKKLAAHPERAMTEMHLNEYNSYKIDYPEGGRQDRYRMASAMLHDFAYFLTQPDLTRVHWAQFQDTAGGNWSGMISWDGYRKASFNAMRLYSMMPVDRNPLLVSDDDVEGWASSDDHQAAVLSWNNADSTRTLHLTLENVPFEQGTLQVYRIDKDNASWGDNPAKELLAPVESDLRTTNGAAEWMGEVPPGGVVYVSAIDSSGQKDMEPEKVASVVRTLRSFPDRGASSYAEFDERTWTARIGTVEEELGMQQVGVVAENLPAALTIAVEQEGKVSKGELCGVRMDFQTEEGYSRSVLVAKGSVDSGGENSENVTQWGTRRAADRVVSVTNLKSFTIEPVKLAPSNWDGRAIITFVLENAGPDRRVKFSVHTKRAK